MRKIDRAWLKRLLLPVLLPLWAAFALSWAIVCAAYPLHLDLFPVPRAGISSWNLVVLILYLPPVLSVLTLLGVPSKGGHLGRALLLVGWALSALFVFALALAAPLVFDTVTQ